MPLKEFLKDIISIPSLSCEESKVAKRIRKEFKKLSYDKVFLAGGNVCAVKGSGSKILLYDAHMDVVEAGSDWEENAFKPKEEEGYIIGRGSCDDKGTLASMVYGGSKAEIPQDMSLFVLCSVKEEIAEGNGLKVFFEKTKIRPDFIVIGEPSSSRISIGNRGRLALKITVKGKAGHASRPEKSVNSIYLANTVLSKIKEHNEKLENDSVVVTKIETYNDNINIIPGICTIYCDYRCAPGKTKEKIIEELKDCIDSDDTIEVISPFYHPWLMKSDHPLIRASSKCLKETLKKDEIISWDFCTNGSFTNGELNIPTVGFGPGEEDEAHTRGEKILMEDVEKAVDFFAKLPFYISKEI